MDGRMPLFIRRLQTFFLVIALIALLVIAKNWYDDYRFDHEPVSPEIQARIFAKEAEIIERIREHYGIDFRVPVIISDKIPGRLYGVATFDTSRDIRVFLNKKRMKESLEYMIDDVLPHEYAHALMFSLGSYRKNGDGHTDQWQDACRKLGGSRCDRYVNHDDVIMGKIPFR